MDSVDISIIRLLNHSGRLKWSDLANRLGLASSSIIERVHKLEKRGIIEGYAAILDPDKAGFPILAFISVTLEKPSHREAFLDFIRKTNEVQECHHLAGEWDYLLKTRFPDMRSLEKFISDGLKDIPGIIRTATTMALSSVKEGLKLPIGEEERL